MKNGKYLDSLSRDKKSRILKNIASHYGLSVADAEDEVRDEDAEMLYEYIANDKSLRMEVYNDMEKGKMAKGGIFEHGLKEGDSLGSSKDNKVIVYPYNKEEQNSVKVVNINKGKRIDAKDYIKMSKKEQSKFDKMAKGGKTKKDPPIVRSYFEDEAIDYAKGGEIGKELMGGQPQSEPKPSGAILLQVLRNGKEIIVSEDGGKTKERYVKSNGYSGYTLRYKGNQYEFTDSFEKGGTMAGWCYSVGGL